VAEYSFLAHMKVPSLKSALTGRSGVPRSLLTVVRQPAVIVQTKLVRVTPHVTHTARPLYIRTRLQLAAKGSRNTNFLPDHPGLHKWHGRPRP
jgi:hypothetical protein